MIIEIDLTKIRMDDKIFIAGGNLGETVYLELLKGKVSESDTITFINSTGFITSNSFHYGLLKGVINLYQCKADLLDRFDISDFNNTNKKEFIRGVNRHFN